jgi:hypothetical protein
MLYAVETQFCSACRVACFNPLRPGCTCAAGGGLQVQLLSDGQVENHSDHLARSTLDVTSVRVTAGSFVSHGARTLSYEAAAAGLGRLLGGAAELQVGPARICFIFQTLITSGSGLVRTPSPFACVMLQTLTRMRSRGQLDFIRFGFGFFCQLLLAMQHGSGSSWLLVRQCH